MVSSSHSSRAADASSRGGPRRAECWCPVGRLAASASAVLTETVSPMSRALVGRTNAASWSSVWSEQTQAPDQTSNRASLAAHSSRAPCDSAGRPRATTDSRGHAVDDTLVPAREQFFQDNCRNGDSIGAPLRTSVVARSHGCLNRERGLAHDARRPSVMVQDRVGVSGRAEC